MSHKKLKLSEAADMHNSIPQSSGTICCIGAGYVGAPTMAVLASHNPKIKVYVVDRDQRKIDAWNSENLPLYEPGLEDYIRTYRDKNLFFSTDVAGAIRESSIIFVAVNTPTKEYGGVRSAGQLDLTSYEAVARTIAQYANSDKVVVEKSTVPVHTARKIKNIINYNVRKGVHVEVISNPEFLAEGLAIKNLENPDRVLIGGEDTEVGHNSVNQLAQIYASWVPRERIITTGVYTSELSKLAANAFLAQRISSINAMSAVCEKTGANVSELKTVLGTDDRIGPRFLNSSVGFGGSCFGKDLRGLVYLCESLHLPEIAQYWKGVLEINEYQKRRFAQNVVNQMVGSIRGKNVCVLGVAFKADTGDIRESPALDVIRYLLEEKANLYVYDPKVNQVELVQMFPQIKMERTAEQAAAECHALVLLTEWTEFKELNWEQMFQRMKKPAFLFDGRNCVDHKRLAEIGFQVFPVGQPPMTTAQFT